ncbi:hypothetical protein IV454_11655 [Massilia antarctica]|uniref:Exo-alpha-sialidase n=1 Tax=Massilia antarctica TaxID=2765360 RepID=A0AA48WII7_9BURK|nr:hypothetical protein [Massilia antarctica]QPI52089.1 hypothetical protein IV454_11655 [Massilia antarctica]
MPLPFKPACALLTGLLLLLASGPSAAFNHLTRADDPLARAPKADEGTVVVSVSTNMVAVLDMTSVRMRRLGGAGESQSAPDDSGENIFELLQVAPALAFDSAVFVGVLPAGDYQMVQVTMKSYQVETVDRLLGWKLTVNRTITPTIGSRDLDLFGMFTVRPGQTVDLGRTVITPLNKMTIIGRSALLSDNRQLLERKSPPHARLLGQNAAPGWTTPPLRDDFAEAIALRRPVGAGCFSEYPDGRIAAAAKMGTVLLRSTEGKWTAVRGTDINSLACVLPVALPNATLIGVGEANTIVRLAPGATTLTPVDPGNLPRGNLIYVAGNERAGWYITLHSDEQVSIFHARDIEGGNWKRVASVPLKKDFWWGQSGFWPWRTERGFGFAVDESLHVLDYASVQWVTRKMPQGMKVAAAQASPNGTIGVRGKMFGGSYISKDEGLSWQEVPTPRNAGVPLQSGDAALWVPSAPLPGDLSAGPILHTSGDLGRKWTQVGQFPGGTLDILPSGAMLTYGKERDFYTIRRSTDNGLSWSTEYHNFVRMP